MDWSTCRSRAYGSAPASPSQPSMPILGWVGRYLEPRHQGRRIPPWVSASALICIGLPFVGDGETDSQDLDP